TIGTHDDEARSSRSKHSRQHETVEEDVLNRMGYDREIDDMLRIRLREARSDEVIFTSVAWIRAFNINEPIYAELCHEFYSTYEFDETIGTHDDEARSSRSKHSRQHETMEEDVLNGMGYDREIDDMLRIRLREARSDEVIFTSVAWIRAFNINEPIYAELC
nr:hypothetical protein [Tanacetum cinerariifolium]